MRVEDMYVGMEVQYINPPNSLFDGVIVRITDISRNSERNIVRADIILGKPKTPPECVMASYPWEIISYVRPYDLVIEEDPL